MKLKSFIVVWHLAAEKRKKKTFLKDIFLDSYLHGTFMTYGMVDVWLQTHTQYSFYENCAHT